MHDRYAKIEPWIFRKHHYAIMHMIKTSNLGRCPMVW